MNSTIQQALDHLQAGSFTGYFDEMSKIVPENQKMTFHQLRDQFISGNYPYNFYQQLMVFAQQIESDANNHSSSQVPEPKPTFTTDKVKKQIIKGDLKEAINEVLTELNKRDDDPLLAKIMTTNDIFKGINSLTMSHSEVSQTRARVIEALLNILSDMK